MVYYVFDTFESSFGNGLLRLNTSRSMALTFPAVPGKYYEMNLADLLTSIVPLRLGLFFNLMKKVLGLISALICHTLTIDGRGIF